MSATTSTAAPRLKRIYDEQVRAKLREKFNLENPHRIPRILKVTVNMGVGGAIENKKRIDAMANDLSAITGQKPKICRARVSVAGFKLREGMPIGVKVDLRRDRMWEFLDRMINIAMPRIRDFRGIKRNSFDGRGNFSLGLSEQALFPEILLDKVEHTQGMDVTIVMSGGSDEMSLELLTLLGMPFRKAKESGA